MSREVILNKIAAVLFDKDGTLFDFNATWASWAATFIEDLSRGDVALAGRLAGAIKYDLGSQRFHPRPLAGEDRRLV